MKIHFSGKNTPIFFFFPIVFLFFFSVFFIHFMSVAYPSNLPSTGGSGGVPCKEAYTAVHKIKYCMTTIGKNEIRMVIPDDVDPNQVHRPMQLAVFLHWDYSRFWEQEWEEYMKFAKENGIFFVRILSANKKYWWRSLRRSWYDFSHSEHLENVLTVLGKRYNIFTEEVLYSGMSGGSTFLTSQWVPLKGAKYPGVVVANCGGVTPKKNLSKDLTPEVRQKISLHYKYYSREKIFGKAIDRSADYYRKAGFPVQTTRMPTKKALHCEPEGGEAYNQVWVRATTDIWRQHLIPIENFEPIED